MPDEQSKSSSSGNVQDRDRRRAARHPFIATAELIEPVTETRLSARVSEISPQGCYVDAINPFPPGSVVSLRIVRDVGSFETPAKVLYNHPGFGMGVIFMDTLPDQLAILEKWIASL